MIYKLTIKVNVFQVTPGDYRLSAIAATPATTPDLLFLPPHIDVNVNGPLLSLKFYQVCIRLINPMDF